MAWSGQRLSPEVLPAASLSVLAVLCFLDFSSLCRPGPWGRGGAGTSACHLPSPRPSRFQQLTLVPLASPLSPASVAAMCVPVSLADSVTEACITMPVFLNAHLRRQALVGSVSAGSSGDKASTPRASVEWSSLPLAVGRTAR